MPRPPSPGIVLLASLLAVLPARAELTPKEAAMKVITFEIGQEASKRLLAAKSKGGARPSQADSDRAANLAVGLAFPAVPGGELDDLWPYRLIKEKYKIGSHFVYEMPPLGWTLFAEKEGDAFQTKLPPDLRNLKRVAFLVQCQRLLGSVVDPATRTPYGKAAGVPQKEHAVLAGELQALYKGSLEDWKTVVTLALGGIRDFIGAISAGLDKHLFTDFPKTLDASDPAGPALAKLKADLTGVAQPEARLVKIHQALGPLIKTLQATKP